MKYLSFSTAIITPVSANLEFWKKKIFRLCFWLNEECPKLRSSLGIDHRRRKTTPLRNSSGENEFFWASLYVWYLQYWALCDALVDFKLWAGVRYLSRTRMYLMKRRGGPIPTGLKRWPLKLVKHLADTACVSPSPAGPTGCCPLNFLYLVNLKFRVRAPIGCCILLFRPNQRFVCNFLCTLRCKSQVPAKEPSV